MATAKAKKVGYFGAVRQPGEEFEVPDGTESNEWFDVQPDDEPDTKSEKKVTEVSKKK